MKTVVFFLYILGAGAAIPTNARFLSDHSKPTTDSLSSSQQGEISVAPGNTAIPILGTEDSENEKEIAIPIEDHPNHEAENSSILKSKEENYEQSEDQEQNHSQESGLKNQEDGDGGLGLNLEYKPTEGTLDLNEDDSEPENKTLPENIDFLASDVSSTVDYHQQESITEEEKSLIHQLNRSSKYNQDLNDQENQEQDPNIPKGAEKEEEEEELDAVGTHNDNQEREEEFPKKHSNTNQEEDSTQPEEILEELSQPTQVSKMQKEESVQSNQEQEDNSKAELEDENASKINKRVQDTEWQSQEGKADLEIVSSHKEVDKKAVPEALLMEPTDDGNSMPRNHEAEDDDDGPKHNTGDDYFIPSQDFLEGERAQPNYYHINNEELKERAHENESVDRSEPGESQGAKKAESSLHEDENSSEGNMRLEGVDSCMSFQCKRGHICKTDLQGKPHCVCQDPVTCPPTKLLDQVCGTDNQTYASSCHLFATKCRLEGTKKGHQLQMDYFGACKSIPACTDFEVTQFPLRMRDWLKNILVQLYEHNPEHAGYLNEKQRNKVKKIYLDEKRLLAGDHPIDLLLRDFKKNYHMYVYPVHWQFSELDQHPMDRILTHSELAPLRASLVPMEHCITRFFEECDPNKDKHITLKEWGHCFGIKEEDIDENLLF
ncbi:PREDICTED: SPARC-like protein 1 [Chrysochloris asiatica]|uniref:SPARC-like protein 1 n=1 Tax=Chrysochloris asiatica TaxID=185453 RepID=A0A9B0TSC2_CHRAS|nr:PREDICTED: SPARC-like protein 1 [Chrysochloris asiatica]